MSSMNTIISVAHAGGQGKTTLAQLLYVASERVGASYKIAAADFIDDSGHSKIGKLYGDKVEEFGTGAQLKAARMENNPNAGLRYWDRFGHVLLSGGYIVDLGANVFPSIAEWAEDRRLASLLDRRNAPRIDVFCICKAEKHALDDMHQLVRSFASGNAFNIYRIFIVLNEAAGPFHGTEFQDSLARAFPDTHIVFLQLPKCQSEIWAAVERKGISLERVLGMDEEEAMQALDIDLWTASAGLAELRSWFEFVLRNFRQADVFSRREIRAVGATPAAPEARPANGKIRAAGN